MVHSDMYEVRVENSLITIIIKIEVKMEVKS